MQIVSSDLARVQRKCKQMDAELIGANARKRLLDTAKRCIEVDIPTAVRGDIGDQSMSRWWRANPIQIAGEVNRKAQLDNLSVEIRPKGKARGPMRVLEDGRQAHEAGDKRVAGVRLRKKTNDYVTKYRKVKRKTGAAAGKQTWSDATSLMARRSRVELSDGLRRAFRKVWG